MNYAQRHALGVFATTQRTPNQLASEIIVDSFAGGGGASLGIELALGRGPDIAIDHDAEAIALHAANHPSAQHYCESVWDVDPVAACAGRQVGLAWFSPDCTHFSKAKGSKPRSNKSRGLAWVVIRWARKVRPRVIVLENVEEFQTWGPLLPDGKPCPSRAGLSFRRWRNALQRLGYVVEYRSLRACDFGVPTTRKRLFLVARCDGKSIAWPTPTHGKGLLPYRTAAEIIDWSVACPSIFGRAKPLADATLARIARGVDRFVLAGAPYIKQGAAMAGGQNGLVACNLVKHYGGNYSGPGIGMDAPLATITTIDHHALVASQLFERNAAVDAMLAGFGVASREVAGYWIADIGMRLLTPRELYRAQGFPDRYQIDLLVDGKPLSKSAQIRMVGNSVCPPLAAAVVSANYCAQERMAA